MTLPMVLAGERAAQLRVMEWAAAWATAELVASLVARPDLVAALDRGASVDDIAALTRLSRRNTGGLLRALCVEEVLDLAADGTYALTALGRSAVRFRGWLDLYVRGYRRYFHAADDLWAGRPEGLTRDRPAVGAASNAMSEHDAIPLLLAAMGDLRPTPTRVLDVGCAEGLNLVRICQERPDVVGVGVEPVEDLVVAARQSVADAGFAERITMVAGEVTDAALPYAPDAVVFAFVLQELLGQQSLPEVSDLLRSLGRRWPDAWFLVIEVDAAGRDDLAALRDSPQRRGYYSLYYLVHDLTEQVLLTFEEWRELFAASGFEVRLERACDPAVDDTDLTRLFALRFTEEVRP